MTKINRTKQLESVAIQLASGSIIHESWNGTPKKRDSKNPDCYRIGRVSDGDVVPTPVFHALLTSGMVKRGHATAMYWIATPECKERYGSMADA